MFAVPVCTGTQRPTAHCHFSMYDQVALELCFHPSWSYAISSSSFHLSWLFLIKLTDTIHIHMYLSRTGWPYEETSCLAQMRISLAWRRQEDCVALKVLFLREFSSGQQINFIQELCAGPVLQNSCISLTVWLICACRTV